MVFNVNVHGPDSESLYNVHECKTNNAQIQYICSIATILLHI